MSLIESIDTTRGFDQLAELHAVLSEVLDDEYKVLLEDARHILPDEHYDSTTIHTAPLCRQAAVGVSLRLNAKGIESRPISVVKPVQGLGEHRYVQSSIGEEHILIDPTWQQFLSTANTDAPKALVGTPEAVRDNAVLWGVDPSLANNIWLDEPLAMHS